MIAIPTVEIRNGLCVRPTSEGNAAFALGDPVIVARSWAHIGFHRVHLVDSDATSGSGSNAATMDDVIRDGALDVQASEAPQSTDRIEQLISAGAVRVVVGPRALDEPDWLAHAAELYPGFLIVETDVRERRVALRGWVRTLAVDVLDLVQELNGLPLGGILVSGGDATRGGFDLSLVEDIAETSEFPIIAAGGVTDLSDLRALEHRGVAAALLGESLYAGGLDARNVAMEFAQ